MMRIATPVFQRAAALARNSRLMHETTRAKRWDMRQTPRVADPVTSTDHEIAVVPAFGAGLAGQWRETCLELFLTCYSRFLGCEEIPATRNVTTTFLIISGYSS